MRRRWVQIDGQLIPADDVLVNMPRADAGALWGDRHYQGLRATDGTPIDTRTRHRDYMRRRGLTTVDDFSESWAKARKARDDFYTFAPDPSRREDVARALDKVLTRR